MAPVERIIGRRIGMERREEHVAAVPEDILRAVAVMVIHIEDRDARHAAVDGRLRGDSSGVEMAIAAQIIAPRMMAGREAQGDGGAIAERKSKRLNSSHSCAYR